MMDDRSDEQLDEWIREAAHSYHSPPPAPAPREEMWHAIQAARRTLDVRPIRRPIRWLAWSVGVAAVLALGVSIGLIIASDRSAPIPIAAADDPSATSSRHVSTALAVVTTEHLTQAETFLTLFRAEVRTGGASSYASGTARHLLATNRLITDSPAGADPVLKELLQDLELVLAQIAQLSEDSWEGETDLITDGIEQRAVLTRLQTVVPAGTLRGAFSL
jgi:hypothetical protein